MVMRSADDSDAISKRITELRQEETDRLNAGCDCPDDVREDGTTIKAHRPDCRHYITPDLHCGLAPLQQQRVPGDDWETLKQQAQSVEAAYLRRLHLRIERARPRSFWAPK